MFWYIIAAFFVVFLLVKYLFRKKCKSCELSWNLWSGYNFWRRYFKIKLWLKLTDPPEGPALVKYRGKVETLEDLGLIAHKSNRYLEEPRNLTAESPQVLDEICFIGVNNGSYFIAKLCRRNQSLTEIWLIFVLKDGTILELPIYPDTRAQSSNEDSFQCQGLKFVCLSAMKKWRITFNGTMKCTTKETTHHVRLSLYWTAMFNPRDNISLKDKGILSAQLAQKGWRNTPQSYNKLEPYLRGHEQWGMIQGTLQMDQAEEMELLYWGPKLRKTGKNKSKDLYGGTTLYGYTEDGKCFNLTKRQIEPRYSLNCGYIGLTSFENHEVTWNFLPNSSTDSNLEHSKIHINRGESCLDLELGKKIFERELCSGEKSMVMIRVFELTLDKESGWTMQILHAPNVTISLPAKSMVKLLKPTSETNGPAVLPLTSSLCKSSYLAGGKGSSLALLKEMNKDIIHKFSVPDGFVISTAAYRKHVSKEDALRLKIRELQEIACKKTKGVVEEACERVVIAFSNGIGI